MRAPLATYQISHRQGRLRKCQGLSEIPRILHLRNDAKHRGDTAVRKDEGADRGYSGVKRGVVK